MTDRKIEDIISDLKQNNKKEESIFGFYHQDGDEYNTSIKANKQGIKLFAVELLKASIEIENRNFENGEIEYLEIDIDWTDSNADFYFNSLEITQKVKTEKDEVFPKYEESWKDKLYGKLIFVIIILLILMLIIGIITTINWII